MATFQGYRIKKSSVWPGLLIDCGLNTGGGHILGVQNKEKFSLAGAFDSDLNTVVATFQGYRVKKSSVWLGLLIVA